ncbi:hypothetical protein DERF_013453 [Dermatophagoides farinae]|uniref:Uncharacterized protein n=1 Tax=Dermatophagoides farinae TaxID=6954 RepID=A0A922L2B5_DERFA|nr:hypothetical protein DERF_013453 [Dermatophagoides farinae]
MIPLSHDIKILKAQLGRIMECSMAYRRYHSRNDNH